MGRYFEWGEAKAQTNEQKHGVSFEEEATVFEDPFSLTIADDAHSDSEDRFIDIGESRDGHLLVVAYTERGETIRISSVVERLRRQNGEHMGNNGASDQDRQDLDDDMAPEYDFSHGVRGQHADSLREGYTVVIHKSDGSTETRAVASRPGAVVLAPDVRAYFSDSASVNRALRGLISLIPQRPSTSEDR